MTWAGVLHAEITEIWNTTVLEGLSDCRYPALHGMTLVWQAKGGLPGAESGNMDQEIFLCDLSSMEVFQLTDDDDDDSVPKTDGDCVVWQKHRGNGDNLIFIFHIHEMGPAGGAMISAADGSDNRAPEIASGQVVWTSHRVTVSYEPAHVVSYSTYSGDEPVIISDMYADCSGPRIDDRGLAVWTQENDDGTVSRWLYDTKEDFSTPVPAPENFVFNSSHSRDGAYNVLTRRDGNDREILLYSRPAGYTRITDNDIDDSSPVISQNHTAWVAGGEIHVADFASHMRLSGLKASRVWNDGFKAEWKPLSGGVDEYMLDISTDPGFSSYVTGYEDLPVGNTPEYEIRGLNTGTVYYFRVRAIVNGSVTADSRTARIRPERSWHDRYFFFRLPFRTGSQPVNTDFTSSRPQHFPRW